MQVRTFQGTSTQEVLAQVKAEMGSDAVILGSREFRKGSERFFEITAGIERQPELSAVVSPAQSLSPAAFPTGFDEWHREWSRMKDHLYALMQPALKWENLNPRQRVALEYLQREGVENDVIVELYNRLLQSENNGSMLAALSDVVPIKPWLSEFWQEHIHVITGPFGAGKTSCALRMALQLRLNNPALSIAFLNTDSTRGNGRLVLRHFAELSGFAYYETPDKHALGSILKKTIDCDYVFIDMQSLARDETLQKRFEVLGLASLHSNVASHICLPPHYSTHQTDKFLKQYSCNFAPFTSSIVWTKLDEALHYGAMVNVAAKTQLPISALSFGSEFNASLCPAQGSMVWRILLKRELPQRENREK